MIQPGGKIVFANEIIRGWLNLPTEDLPNLEHLARQARPGEIFLSLCAAPGQARFSMKGLMVDGISYTIPYQESQAVLVSLRRSDLTVLTQEESSISGKALDILTELSRAMTASLDLEATLQAILESVEHLIPSDISEITVWDPNQEQLIPYGFTGLQGIDRHLEKLPTAYNPNEGYSGYIFSNRKPLLVKDVNTFREARPALDRRNFPMRSYLGVPLMIAGEPIGTLELGSLITDTFSENDQDILSILSSQAAVALKNALVHREEERRVAELTGLARLAQAAGTLRDPRDLYSHLIQSILPLLDVEILGFMIFDKTQNRLNGQVPFVGIPDHFVAMYQTEIPSNSAAEEIWLSQETILAPNAPENPKLQTLGLAHLAQATGIQNTVLTPLTLRGRSIGYIQAANKSDSTPFVEEDLRILAIVAGQAAPIIQNANLIQETRRRAQQAEALRKVAALAGSAATLDEILTFSLIEIARLLQADTASIFILDEGRYELRLHKNSLFGIAPERFGRLSRIAVDDPQFHNTVTSNQRAIAFENGNHNGSLPPFYHILTQTLQAESAVSVPLIVRDRGIGEMILGSQKENFFSIADIELASTAAGQMAGAIERSFLYIQTDETLRRRVEQLTSITRISRELNASLELRRLLRLVYNEALFNTGADCGTILLFDLNTSEPESPNIALRIGDSPKDSLLPIERAVLETEEPLVIENFTRSDFEPPHKDVLTSLIVPIAHQE
ncbi:MAG: GAF domain-containing protein, partial [Anaerolineales bacterium]